MLEVVSGKAALSQVIEVKSSVELPNRREAITLHTSDGLNLVGELAMPLNREPVATLIMLHPLPTHGGFMDSHIYRKAANRLPALADLAVLRFNTRGTSSPHGTSEGQFGEGITEEADVRAAVAFAKQRKLPNLWVVGWSFGTELALKYAVDEDVLGAILLSPPLHRTTDEELLRWNQSDKKLVALIPEFDDYLTPEQAKLRFSMLPKIDLIGVEGAKHLWVGEAATKRVLDEIVRVVNPQRYPLAETFSA
jgi:alpha/beta superfamily hydrolase